MWAHGEIAQQYADLRRTPTAAHPDDLNAYMDRKDAFIQEIDARAQAWVEASRPV